MGRLLHWFGGYLDTVVFKRGPEEIRSCNSIGFFLEKAWTKIFAGMWDRVKDTVKMCQKLGLGSPVEKQTVLNYILKNSCV